jgi:hypothetical protein
MSVLFHSLAAPLKQFMPPAPPAYDPIGINGESKPTMSAPLGNYAKPAAPVIATKPTQPMIGSSETMANADAIKKWIDGNTDAGIKSGEDYFTKYYGLNNPEVQSALIAMKNRAMGGLTMPEMTALRDRGTAGINSQTATNLHQLRGVMGASGVHGGAAGGAALPVLNTAAQQRTKLEGDIANADLNMRQGALKDYYSMLTNERGGFLGSVMGMAGVKGASANSGLAGALSIDQIKSLSDLVAKLGAGNPGAVPAQVSGVGANTAGAISDAVNGGGGNIPFSLPSLPGFANFGDNLSKPLSWGSPY